MSKYTRTEHTTYTGRLLADDGSTTSTCISVHVTVEVHTHKFSDGTSTESRGQSDYEWSASKPITLEPGTSLRMTCGGKVYVLGDVAVTQLVQKSNGSGTTYGVATSFEPA